MPDACGNLEELVDELVDYLGRDVLGRRADHERPRKVSADRILQVQDHRIHEALERDVGPEARRRCFQDQSCGSPRMIDPDPSCDQARCRMPGEHRPIDRERVEELDDVGREVTDLIAALRLVRVDVAALRQSDGSNPGRQPVEHRFIRPPRIRGARQQQGYRPDGAPCSAYESRSPDPRVTIDSRSTARPYCAV